MRRLSELAINQNGFAFDPTFGESFLLNESGILALRLLTQTDLKTAAETLASTYGIDPGEALSDLIAFQAKLRILGFEVDSCV